jgi:tryptophan-rich sensory protein
MPSSDSSLHAERSPGRIVGSTSGLGLAGWVFLVYLASVPGVLVTTASEYRAFELPAWAPPGWVFGPVWTALYAMMAVAAWLVWREGGGRAQRGPLSLFLVQLALNAAWTPLFFGADLRGWAFALILVLWAAIAATLAAFCRVHPLAGWLLAPYLAWVTFAAALSFAVWRLNG